MNRAPLRAVGAILLFAVPSLTVAAESPPERLDGDMPELVVTARDANAGDMLIAWLEPAPADGEDQADEPVFDASVEQAMEVTPEPVPLAPLVPVGRHP